MSPFHMKNRGSDVFLSLGSNMGNRMENLKNAISAIQKVDGCRLIKVSSVYETPPWGYSAQENFLNLCLSLETTLSPNDLLLKTMEIEKELKRERNIRFGPRTIDIDMLFYDELKQDDELLTLPHPRLFERAFVLVPLLEILPEGHFCFDKCRHKSEELDKSGINLFSVLE